MNFKTVKDELKKVLGILTEEESTEVELSAEEIVEDVVEDKVVEVELATEEVVEDKVEINEDFKMLDEKYNTLTNDFNSLKGEFSTLKSELEIQKENETKLSSEFSEQIKTLNETLKVLVKIPAEFSKTDNTIIAKDSKEEKMNQMVEAFKKLKK